MTNSLLIKSSRLRLYYDTVQTIAGIKSLSIRQQLPKFPTGLNYVQAEQVAWGIDTLT